MTTQKQAILEDSGDELIEYYKYSEAKLARRLLWLSTFLQRAETVPLQDKQRVEERLNMFDFLLEQNEFVQKQKALAEIEASQRILIDVVRRRFPNLVELAQKRAARRTQVDVLREVIGLISIAPDEATARLILSPSAA